MLTNELTQVTIVGISQLSLIFFKHVNVRTIIAKQIYKSMIFTFAIQSTWLISSAIGIKAFLDDNLTIITTYLLGGVIGSWLNFKIKI